MPSQAATIARRMRSCRSEWDEWSDVEYVANEACVGMVEDSPIGQLWLFDDGSYLMANELYELAVARGYFREIATMHCSRRDGK